MIIAKSEMLSLLSKSLETNRRSEMITVINMTVIETRKWSNCQLVTGEIFAVLNLFFDRLQ